MRILRRPARAALLVSVGSVAAFACVSSSNDAPPNPDVDASVDQTDAGSFDASPTTPDAREDSTIVDAGQGLDTGAVESGGANVVTVVVTTQLTGAPESGVTVVFQDATGAVLGTTTTDANGSASQADVGGEVTVLLGTALQPVLVTIFGVQAGDVLNVTDVTAFVQTQGQAIVTAVPATPPAGTTTYLAQVGSCSADFAAPPGTVSLYAGTNSSCVSRGKFPLLVTAQNANADPIGFAFQNGNTFVSDGGTSIALAGAWTAPGSMTIGVTNAPGNYATSDVELDEIANGIEIASTSNLSADGGVGSTTVVSHPGYADFVESKLGVSGSGQAFQQVATRTAAPGATGSVSFDLAMVLPTIQSASIATTDPTRPTISWTTSASTASTAGTLFVFSWAGNGGLSGGWTMVVPPGTTSVQAPALPSDAGTWVPPAHPDFTGPAMWIVSGDALPTYAAARASLQATFALSPTSFSNAVPILAADGTIRISGWSE
jgi:hypothetical protein